MKKIIEKAQNDTTTMKLTIIVSFLLGFVFGMMLSPAKNGLSIGSNNTIIGTDDDDDDED